MVNTVLVIVSVVNAMLFGVVTPDDSSTEVQSVTVMSIGVSGSSF